MEVPTNPSQLVDLLRAWFYAKDRSILLAIDTFLNLGIVKQLKISGGEVTKTQSYHQIATESNAGTDDLDTISGGREGDLLLIRQESDDEDVTLTENGNIQVPSGPDLVLDTKEDLVGLLYDGTNWLNFANPFGRMSLIVETVLAVDTASVTFNNIPGNFRNLLIISQLRTDRAAELDLVSLRFNGDSGNNYDFLRAALSSAGFATAVTRGATEITAGLCDAASARASNFTPHIFRILGYPRNDREKWAAVEFTTTMGDVSADTDLFIQPATGRWRNTSPITSITLLPGIGTNFVTNSTFQLYGIL